MRTNKVFTPDQISKMKELRTAGTKMQAIADAVGHSKKAVQNKIYGIEAAERKAAKVGRPKGAYKVRKFKAPIEAAAPTTTKKPMIAFVGEPGEITTAIKELFS